MRTILPNILTASNIVLGIFAIISTFHNMFDRAALFILAALIADSLDGRVARLFKVSSDFGKELDSLCDLVSFGVAPAFLAYVFYLRDFGMVGAAVAAVFATCGALRLARFNVNTTVVKGYFMGLPIPAAGCIVATFVMTGIRPSDWIFPIMVLLFAYLMVSTVRYPDFKGKDGEPIRIIPSIITVAMGISMFFLLRNAVLFIPLFCYGIFGVVNTLFGFLETRKAA